ncbi:MAG: hypothetical protein V4592_24260 [Bacteroidota bacterium]
MAKEDTADLLNYLAPLPPEVRDKVLWLRDFVWDEYPQCNELIYDNYNAVAIGWSPTEKLSHIFCSIAVYRAGHNIHFGFYWGTEVPDPKKMLIGNGNQYRYIQVKDLAGFPRDYMRQLVMDAYILSLNKVKDQKQIVEGKTILKSVSANKRVAKK